MLTRHIGHLWIMASDIKHKWNCWLQFENLVYRHLCDMCLGVCTDMCTDMCIDVCVGTCADMCADMRIALCTDMCMYVHRIQACHGLPT